MADPEKLESVEEGERSVVEEAEENDRKAYAELLKNSPLVSPEVGAQVQEHQEEYVDDQDELRVASEDVESSMEEPPNIREIYEMMEAGEWDFGPEEEERSRNIGEGLSRAEGVDNEAMMDAVNTMNEVAEQGVEEDAAAAESLKERMRAVGSERLQSVADKAALLAAPDVLVGAGVRKTKEFAKKAGRLLAGIGLSPFAAIEDASRKLKGTVDVGIAGVKTALAETEVQAVRDMTPEQKASLGEGTIERIGDTYERMREKRVEAVRRFRKKGFLAGIVDNLKAKL